MLVSDLLEIGVQQRKAYQEAKQKAAPGTPPSRRKTEGENGRAHPHIRNLRLCGKRDRPGAGRRAPPGRSRDSTTSFAPGSEGNRAELKRLGIRLVHGDLRAASDIDALPPATG
jgi:hypothetical protein